MQFAIMNCENHVIPRLRQRRPRGAVRSRALPRGVRALRRPLRLRRDHGRDICRDLPGHALRAMDERRPRETTISET